MFFDRKIKKTLKKHCILRRTFNQHISKYIVQKIQNFLENKFDKFVFENCSQKFIKIFFVKQYQKICLNITDVIK